MSASDSDAFDPANSTSSKPAPTGSPTVTEIVPAAHRSQGRPTPPADAAAPSSVAWTATVSTDAD